MKATRREILKTSGLATAGIVGATGAVAAGDADPRAEPVEGEKPNANVPTTEVGTLPGETTSIPAGDWIAHTNGWVSRADRVDECGLPEFLDETTQVFTIAGEEFVLDGLDDWEFTNPDPSPEDICSARFSLVTPPKPAGTTYEMRWDVYGDESKFPVIQYFPFANELEVVGHGKGNRSTGSRGKGSRS